MPLYAVVTLTFLGMAFMLFYILYVLMPKKTLLEERVESLIPKTEELTLLEKPLGAWQKFLGKFGRKVPLRPSEYGKHTRNLVAAGMRKETFTAFMGAKVLLTVLFPTAYIVFYGIFVGKDLRTMALFAAGLAIVGFLAPSYWLLRKVKKRQIGIFHDLPDILDLMTVCVEAGLSLDAAMIRVGEDPQFRKSSLAAEMKTAIHETRAGKPRLEALRDMGERTMVDDLRAFASMLIQTERLGTSLVQSLRIHSDSLRTIRRQNAEEAAAKTSIKLVFPLVFFVFPALLVVILGPGLIRVFKLFAE